MKPLVLFVLLPAFSLMAFPAPPPDEAPPARAELDLARKILGDPTLREVHRRSWICSGSGFECEGLCEVWIRDLNTFIEAALEVTEPDRFREALSTFCTFRARRRRGRWLHPRSVPTWTSLPVLPRREFRRGARTRSRPFVLLPLRPAVAKYYPRHG
ncbi:MAG: hypothetical protein U1G07_19370 [Verrucomicrobiota bacterium]